MRSVAMVTGAAFLLGLAVTAGAEEKKNEPFNDANFVKKAAADGMHEVELAKIAKEKSTDAEVKQFAERLLKDHMKCNEDLKMIAREANLSVPDKLPPEKQKEVDRFRNYTGQNFDRDFMQHQVKDHQKAVELFTKASKECQNEKLKSFAAKTLPTLQEHLDMAKKIHDRLEKK